MVRRVSASITENLYHETVKDTYPLLLLRTFVHLKLDMASGYLQVAMNENDRHKTTIVSHKGLYQFKVMHFGLTNSPVTSAISMENVLTGLQWERCLVYLDGVIVFGTTLKETWSNLIKVFDRFKDGNLKLKKKWILFCKEVSFLEHVVSKDGVKCDPNKISTVQD